MLSMFIPNKIHNLATLNSGQDNLEIALFVALIKIRQPTNPFIFNWIFLSALVLLPLAPLKTVLEILVLSPKALKAAVGNTGNICIYRVCSTPGSNKQLMQSHSFCFYLRMMEKLVPVHQTQWSCHNQWSSPFVSGHTCTLHSTPLVNQGGEVGYKSIYIGHSPLPTQQLSRAVLCEINRWKKSHNRPK